MIENTADLNLSPLGKLTERIVLSYIQRLSPQQLKDLVENHPKVATHSPSVSVLPPDLQAIYYTVTNESLQKLVIGGVSKGLTVTLVKAIVRRITLKVTLEIVRKVTAKSAYRVFRNKLVLAATIGSTGLGIAVSAISVGGIVEKASQASDRLAILDNEVYAWAYMNNVDMLFLLMEKSMTQFLEKDKVNDMKTFQEFFRYARGEG